ncbi:MAG: PGF-pre-PGF domain-containing protein, partial [archaeon]
LEFRINNSWLNDNNYKKENVYLFRYNNKSWEKLKTTFDRLTTRYHYYKAETPGFSTFAIAVEQEDVVTDVNEEEISEEETNVTESFEEPTTSIEDIKNNWYWILIIILILVVGVIGSYIWFKK